MTARLIAAARAEITRLRAQVASLTAAVEGERERCARVVHKMAMDAAKMLSDCAEAGDLSEPARYAVKGNIGALKTAAAAIREGG